MNDSTLESTPEEKRLRKALRKILTSDDLAVAMGIARTEIERHVDGELGDPTESRNQNEIYVTSHMVTLAKPGDAVRLESPELTGSGTVLSVLNDHAVVDIVGLLGAVVEVQGGKLLVNVPCRHLHLRTSRPLSEVRRIKPPNAAPLFSY